MSESELPQCISTVRLHQMILDGLFEERELLAMATDRRVGPKYQRLRACDDHINAMRERGKAAEGGADPATLKPPELLYAQYIECTSSSLCRKSLVEWANCMQAVKTQHKPIGECALLKRLLERCMRDTTEELLKTSQPEVFRPSATP
ncbi:hypothetical protein V7S43_002749 [Phytophthora oleae]|uniref:COX assembly mitochondrial protein n=1 Tax=Phytophthora oleae TaxID=2107226 RepID=A0ABD3G219_9STRA